MNIRSNLEQPTIQNINNLCEHCKTQCSLVFWRTLLCNVRPLLRQIRLSGCPSVMNVICAQTLIATGSINGLFEFISSSFRKTKFR